MFIKLDIAFFIYKIDYLFSKKEVIKSKIQIQ